MSRGLGKRQWLMLQALRVAEDAWHGKLSWFLVSSVLEETWSLGLREEDEARKAHWRSEREQIAKLAAAGDEDAKNQQRGYDRMDTLAAIIRKGRRRRRRFKMRPLHVEATLNPSRILAGLAKRGLVERNAKCGYGSMVSLTDRGRDLLAARGISHPGDAESRP